MAFVTKTWKDRLVEFSGRRKLKNISTEEEIIYDVSRSEGTVMQVGDQFSAENMNNLEQRIKTEFDSVSSSLNGCSFEQEGEDFYIVGADAVRKKLGSVTLYIRATSNYVSDSNLSRKLVLEISTDNKTWKTVASSQFKADVSRTVAYTYNQ